MSDILFPVGRMIGGSVYKAQDRLDNFGKPKLDAQGVKMTEYSFGVAIPKAGEQHWSQTPWGQQILAVGQSAYTSQYTNPAFAWKIIDGDSAVPNKKNRKPCDQEGYKGNWVLWFKQSWVPKLVSADGTKELLEPGAIEPGYFIQVFGSVKSNAPSPTPGVYLNPVAVALAGYGERIETQSVDTASVGFGAGPKPAGMSPVPLPGMVTPPPNVSVASPFGMPAAAAAQVAQAAGFGQVAPPPNHAILTIPPIPVPVAAHQMTPKAAGATYEQMIGGGWNDALLRQHGYML